MKMKYLIAILEILLVSFLGFPKTKTTKKPDAYQLLKQGREAFYNYDFDNAADFYEQYRDAIKKTKQPVAEELEVWEQELRIAANAFDRVQKIVILDSLEVNRDKFFVSYSLAKSSGVIGEFEDIKSKAGMADKEVAFLSEDGDYLISPVVVEDNEEEESRLELKEARKLLDGSWELQDLLQDDLDKSGDYAYPFMSGDGQTFYFANNGEESMGGYDIFVAQRDPMNGEFRQPLNLGMPFNSPYDDFMMAIDEENGIGWWATDRNSEDGYVTVYIFIWDEVRKNYPDDTEGLDELARITNYKTTWETGKEQQYRRLLNKIKH